jgi:hypothetical protein
MAALIVSIIVVLAFVMFYGHYRFYRWVEKDKRLLFNHSGNTEQLVDSDDFKELPELMVNYLKEVGVEGKCKDCHLTLKQHGRIRKDAKSKWMDLSAQQFITSVPTGFIWAARSFPMFVKDKSVVGIGETFVTLFGLFTIAKERSEKINQSALGRYLAELPLYPVAFLNDRISYKTLDDRSVSACITIEGTTAKGVFSFNKNGLIQRFESERYRGADLERFTGEFYAYKTFAGLYVPTKLKAIWNLKEGNFDYFIGEIVDYQID